MKLLTVKEAARGSGIGVGLLRSLIKSGQLPVVLIPGRQFVLVDPADLDRLIQSFKSGSLSGSSEVSQVAEVQSSSAQNKKSRKATPAKRSKAQLPYYERHPSSESR